MIFGDPDMGFFQTLINFIVVVVLFIGALYIVSHFLESRSGNTTESVIKRIVIFIATPFYRFRSILPDKGKSVFDIFMIVLYCLGAGLLVIYGSN